MLVIRLFRTGKKNQPSFKIIVTEKTRPPRGGRFVEEVGFYNPLTKEKNLKAERMKYWLSVGAKPSATVYNLLVSEKIVDGKKIPKHKKKTGEPEAKTAEAPVEKKEAKEKAPVEKSAEDLPGKEPTKEKLEQAPKEELDVEEKPAEKIIEAEPQSLEPQSLESAENPPPEEKSE